MKEFKLKEVVEEKDLSPGFYIFHTHEGDVLALVGSESVPHVHTGSNVYSLGDWERCPRTRVELDTGSSSR